MKKNVFNESNKSEVILCYNCNGLGHILNAILNNGDNLQCPICKGLGRLIKYVTIKYSTLE